MRTKYYIRLFGQMNYKKSFVLFIIILIFIASIFSSIQLVNKISPAIKLACESKAKAIGVQITEETVRDVIETLEYESLMNIKYNDQGKIIAISANIIQLNKLSSQIAYKIQEELNNLDKITVEIPIGKMVGLNIFSGYGPDINIKVVPMGNVETDFKTEFVAQGINQTKHTIYMEIESKMTVVAPFASDTVVCSSTVTIGETIIIGDIPSSYYNIEDLTGAANEGVLDVLE